MTGIDAASQSVSIDFADEEVDDILTALEMVRADKNINFVGAGATCNFDDKSDQINRSFLHQVIDGGKNKIVGVVA